MEAWKQIQDYVFEKIRDPETNLTKLSVKSGVSIWWLHRIKYRGEQVKDPGWIKTGLVFQALGGRSPKIPKEK